MPSCSLRRNMPLPRSFCKALKRRLHQRQSLCGVSRSVCSARRWLCAPLKTDFRTHFGKSFPLFASPSQV